MQVAHIIIISEHFFIAYLNVFSISSHTRSNRLQRFTTYREKKIDESHFNGRILFG